MDPVLKWSFLGVGLFAVAVMLLLLRRPLRLLRAGGKATGEVTGNSEEVHAGSKGPARTYFFPQIAYTTAKGERVTFKSASGGARPLPVGTPVKLVYDPAQPSDAMVSSPVAMWLFPILVLVFGSPFLALGVWGLMQ